MGRILLEMNLERTALGAMAISTAAIDDVIGWVLLGVATALATNQFNVVASAAANLSASPFFSGCCKNSSARRCGNCGEKHVHDAHEKGMPNSFLALLLVALFASCLVTHYLGIFVIFGAFLFGTCLHQEPAMVKAWRDRFSGVVLVAFVPIFFTNTGLNTKIGALQTPEAWLACALVLVAAVAGKLGGCYLGARLTGQPPREAGSIAALMNTRALDGPHRHQRRAGSEIADARAVHHARHHGAG